MSNLNIEANEENYKNHLPPIEINSQKRAPNHYHLNWLHVWQCPIYVLEPKLQDAHKLPKRSPRSHGVMYPGLLTNHLSTVSRVLNLNTGHISPQYHLVCDDTSIASLLPNTFSK